MKYDTIQVHTEESVCYLQLNRHEASNTINRRLVAECTQVLDFCEESANVIVLSGSPQVFCLGADFREIANADSELDGSDGEPDRLYDLWLRMATGPYIVISEVRGKANAGGMGFVAASDVVLADESAQFSLSEMLFGLFPACVLPFLIRRVGFQRAHYMSLMTHPVSARQAVEWGLVDACDNAVDVLLRRHLQRLKRLSKRSIRRYKAYASQISAPLHELKGRAVTANRQMFADPANREAITRYVNEGLFPWETSAKGAIAR